MKHVSRLSVAISLVVLLAVIGTGVWAAPKFQGTTPLVPATGGGGCDPAKPVDMGTAVFTPASTTCVITVELVADPASQFAGAPEGSAFVGDTFTVALTPDTDTVQICYAYPPDFADKEAKIYKFNDTANPAAWEEVTDPAPVISDGTYCVTSTSGVFSLIGKP
jgi:hypothetical protein